MNTLTLEEVITLIVGRLSEKGFSATEVPEHHKNFTLSSMISEDYIEYKVMYKEDIVCYIQVWESAKGSVKLSLLRMLPEFEKVPNTGAIEELVERYDGLIYTYIKY